MTDAGVGAKAAPQAMAKPGLPTTPKDWAAPSGPPAAQAAPDPARESRGGRQDGRQDARKGGASRSESRNRGQDGSEGPRDRTPLPNRRALSRKNLRRRSRQLPIRKGRAGKESGCCDGKKEEPAGNKLLTLRRTWRVARRPHGLQCRRRKAAVRKKRKMTVRFSISTSSSKSGDTGAGRPRREWRCQPGWTTRRRRASWPTS